MKNNILFEEKIAVECKNCSGLEVSDLDLVAINQGHHVIVWELNCSSTNSTVYKVSKIPIEPNIPDTDTSIIKTSNINHLWKRSVSEIRNSILAPQAEGIYSKYGQVSNIRALQFKFSPVFNNNCYLAILSSSGAVEIYHYVANEWIHVFNLNEKWLETCSENWDDPVSYEKWLEQVETCRPSCISWTCYSQNLYILFATQNGKIVIFSKTREDEFSMEITFSGSSKMYFPTTINAFLHQNLLNILVANFDGEVAVVKICPETWKVHETSLLIEKDYFDCKQVIVSESNKKILINKGRFILSLNMENLKECIEREMDCMINSVNLSKNCVLVFQRSKIVRLSLPTLETCEEIPLGDSYQFAATSRNGYYTIVAKSLSPQISLVSVHSKADVNTAERLQSIANCDLTKYLDLLWVHKLSLLSKLDVIISADEKNDDQFPRLRYWELILCIYSQAGNLTELEDLERRTGRLEAFLIRKFLEDKEKMEIAEKIVRGDKSIENCLICGGCISYLDMRISKCVNEHVLPRCCFTLSPISIADSTSVCILCSSTISTTSNGVDMNKNCPYCGGIFRPPIMEL